MLKLMIIDDEPYVREGLKHIIDWESLGYEVCAEAAQGEEALEKLLNTHPDVVLIDIQMPGKSGLEIIKESQQKGYKGRFIIISGYSNFTYAKQAMKYGVLEYLLKPIDEDELLDLAKKLKGEIEEEISVKESREREKKALMSYILEQLILGKRVNGYEDLKAEYQGSQFQVAIISNSLAHRSMNIILKAEELVAEEANSHENIHLLKTGERLTMIFQDINESYALMLLHKIWDRLRLELKGSSFISLGERVRFSEGIHLAYESAKSIIHNSFLFSYLGVASYRDIRSIADISSGDERKLIESLYTSVEIGELQQIEKTIQELEKLLINSLAPEDSIKATITRSYIDFEEKISKDYGVKLQDFKELNNIIDEIYKQDNLREMLRVLNEKLVFISREISSVSSDKSIKRIVRFIEKNYYKDLKLEGLAETFSYNSAYLGKLFKSYTGESFNSFLDKKRIEVAKELLVKKDLKVYEVCTSVGYKNIDYFHSKFKKYVGMSPRNYKKQKEKEEERGS